MGGACPVSVAGLGRELGVCTAALERLAICGAGLPFVCLRGNVFSHGRVATGVLRWRGGGALCLAPRDEKVRLSFRCARFFLVYVGMGRWFYASL